MVFLYPFIAGYHQESVVFFLAKASVMTILYLATLGIITRWEIVKIVGNLLVKEKGMG
jgi:hypothetical protein